MQTVTEARKDAIEIRQKRTQSLHSVSSADGMECKTHRHCGHLFSNPQKPVLRLLRYFSAVSNVSFVSSRHDPDSSRRPMNACSLLHHPRSGGHQPTSCLFALSPPSVSRVVCRNKLPSRSTGAQLNEHVTMHCAIGLNGFYRPACFYLYPVLIGCLPFSQPCRGSPIAARI